MSEQTTTATSTIPDSLKQRLENLRQKLAEEPWVALPRKLDSPFSVAAQKLEDCSYWRAKYTNEGELRTDYSLTQTRGSYGIGYSRDVDVCKLLREVDDYFKKLARGETAATPENIRALSNSITFFPLRYVSVKNTYSYQNTESEQEGGALCSVPSLNHMTPEAIALYLALIGEIESPVPLRVARAVLAESFNWNFTLNEIGSLGTATAEIPIVPDSPFRIAGIVRDDNHNVVFRNAQGRADSGLILARGWRMRNEPILSWLPLSTPDPAWPELPAFGGRDHPWEAERGSRKGLVRQGKRFAWLSPDPPPPDVLVCPNLITLSELAPQVEECLKLWRSDAGNPQNATARFDRWSKSKASADPLVAQIAEGILSRFTPWPEPFRLASTGEHLTRDRCKKQIEPLFSVLLNAPLKSNPPALVANFLTLIEYRPTFVARPHPEVAEAWCFKLKTRDHTWIEGEILVVPGGSISTTSGKPLEMEVKERPDNDPRDRYRLCCGLVQCGPVKCFIKETRE